MPSLILSTCGTSLFTNGISNELRKAFNEYANAKNWADIPADVAELLQAHAEQQERKLLEADEGMVRSLSAELNSLLSWKTQLQNMQPNSPQDMYLLLATDTALGRSTAEIIQQWLQQQGYSTNIVSASGLNTATLNGFRESLSELVKTLVELLTSYKERGYSIYFNLTGGFKALNGFLQALSTIYADQTFYLFEGSKELLFIPRLPFSLDAEQLILKDLHIFRRLAYQLAVSSQQCKDLPDSLLFYIDDQATLSEWGELLWQSCYKKIYQQQLFPSISEKVIVASGFEKTTKDLPLHILQIVNDRIAMLAVYAEGGFQSALHSLDPKPLQEKKYTDRNLWECNLDAHHRIFMQKKGDTLVLEKVVQSLH